MSLTAQTSTNSKAQGFTLIELVIVIIVLGILAAGAIPKLTSKSGFEPYTIRDQLIARLRLVQLQGMNADPAVTVSDNACYWLVVENDCFYHEHTAKNAGVCNVPSAANVCNKDNDDYNQYNRVIFTDDMLKDAEGNYRFSIDGKLINNNTGSPITTRSEIKISGETPLDIKIETEGYIHE